MKNFDTALKRAMEVLNPTAWKNGMMNYDEAEKLLQVNKAMRLMNVLRRTELSWMFYKDTKVVITKEKKQELKEKQEKAQKRKELKEKIKKLEEELKAT